MSDTDNSDSERSDFRKQLSELTFEELIELKQKVGVKVFNETVKGKNVKQNLDYKRTHKKRPREISSKIPVDTFRKVVPLSNTKVVNPPRDPRFDSSCGQFDEQVFNKSYSFVKDMRAREKQSLLGQLKVIEDPEKQNELKFLMQRIENKEREERKKAAKAEAETEERLSRKQAVKDGKKPHFYKKSEKKLFDLVDNYEALKKSGKLMKHIERKIKSQKAKDRKNRVADKICKSN